MSDDQERPTLKVNLESSGLVNEQTGEVKFSSSSEGWIALRELEQAIGWAEGRIDQARNKVRTLKAEVRTQEGRIAAVEGAKADAVQALRDLVRENKPMGLLPFDPPSSDPARELRQKIAETFPDVEEDDHEDPEDSSGGER